MPPTIIYSLILCCTTFTLVLFYIIVNYHVDEAGECNVHLGKLINRCLILPDLQNCFPLLRLEKVNKIMWICRMSLKAMLNVNFKFFRQISSSSFSYKPEGPILRTMAMVNISRKEEKTKLFLIRYQNLIRPT